MTRAVLIPVSLLLVVLAGCMADSSESDSSTDSDAQDAPAATTGHEGHAHEHGSQGDGSTDHVTTDDVTTDDDSHDHSSHDHAEPAAKPAGFTGNETCPVSNEPVDPELFVEVGNQKVYVCCEDCIEDLKADPEKYAAAAYRK